MGLGGQSASLIGRVGSSAFRLSTTTVATSLAGSCFSTESAQRPFHHGIRRRGGTIFRAALPSDKRQVQADSRTHLIHRPASDTIPPLGGARVSSCRDLFYVALMPLRFPWSSGTLCRQPRYGAGSRPAVAPARQSLFSSRAVWPTGSQVLAPTPTSGRSKGNFCSSAGQSYSSAR